ncbi:FAD:protein FMN transferase [Olivibacter sp. SDN3]|uniref:FAD:protein FMN transferase n=1 Tax=Olivibacter sp. SDN3 TaxID=2764720 RepID=UPI001651213B|nr:FAD:protein FMN transferase [Olivibacter sp. SDN3]QNL48652.1 FAD:protein FMN transferase [Olivibacter sp. SDN3]
MFFNFGRTRGFVKNTSSCWLCVLALLFCSFSISEIDDEKVTLTGFAQGTSYNITYYSSLNKVYKSEIDSILDVIDNSMSLYKDNSLISKFNTENDGITIDDHFKKVVEKSIQIYEDTNGLFDITVASLVEAWGFGVKSINEYPDSATIRNLKACVGTNLLILEGNYLSKSRPCVKIDVNGIAQGYSVDVVANYLLSKGINVFVVEIGGELRINGLKPDGDKMRIGIEGPSADNQEPVIRHVVALHEGAITTSGNYRKYKTKDDKRISHLIDPRSGFPIETPLISVTLVAKDAITADGYDNAIMAMEIDDALQFVENHKDMEAYIIYHDNAEANKQGVVRDTMTSGFKKLLTN